MLKNALKIRPLAHIHGKISYVAEHLNSIPKEHFLLPRVKFRCSWSSFLNLRKSCIIDISSSPSPSSCDSINCRPGCFTRRPGFWIDSICFSLSGPSFPFLNQVWIFFCSMGINSTMRTPRSSREGTISSKMSYLITIVKSVWSSSSTSPPSFVSSASSLRLGIIRYPKRGSV